MGVRDIRQMFSVKKCFERISCSVRDRGMLQAKGIAVANNMGYRELNQRIDMGLRRSRPPIASLGPGTQFGLEYSLHCFAETRKFQLRSSKPEMFRG